MADTEIIKGLTEGQLNQIRYWRHQVARAMWDLNESNAFFEMKRKHEVGAPWSPQAVIWLSKEIERLVVKITTIHRSMVKFLKVRKFNATYYAKRLVRGPRGKLGKWQRRIAGQISGGAVLGAKYRDHVELAADGLQMAVGFLNSLTPRKLDDFVDANLDLIQDDFENLDDLFLSICPTVGILQVAQTGKRAAKLSKRRSTKRAEGRVVDRLASGDLSGAIDAVLEYEKGLGVSPEGDYIDAGCYNMGMASLRLVWKELNVAVDKKRQVQKRFLEENEAYWYRTIKESRANGQGGRPPEEITKQYAALAEAEKSIIQVYDSEGNLVHEAYPEDKSAAGEYLKAKLAPRSRPRQQWGFRDVTPTTGREFAQSLSPAQSKKVEKFLKAHPDRQISIWELAWVADVDVAVLGPEGVPWAPEQISVTGLKRETLEGIGYKPNAPVIDYANVFQDYGMAKAMWAMDIPL